VTTTEDIDFWLREGLASQPLLELGCGTGRLTIPLAASGIEITGLDISESMLRRARSKAKDADVEVMWLRGDMRAFDLDRQFAMIFCPFGTFNHLRHDEIAPCLISVGEHLLPGGHFLLDTFNSTDSDDMPCDDGNGFSSFTRSVIEEVLTSSGFSVMATYGDYDRSEYSIGSKRLILKASIEGVRSALLN
jgi:2-polyprenyl-3-methyl-5-hydroxy-6-metoxy-1,4-benzoquinol methylase